MASPSLAGASICTPTASSPISANHLGRVSVSSREGIGEEDEREGAEYGPVMVAILEPGLAWTEMATVDGGISRRQPGNSAVAAAAALAGAGGAPLAALPRFPGAIFLRSRFVFTFLK